MKIFLDTSSLFKLYHKESGTQELMDFFNWKEGLRTLDSIQLASVLMIRDKVDFFFTSDNLLAEIASHEKIKVK